MEIVLNVTDQVLLSKFAIPIDFDQVVYSLEL